MLTLPVFPFWKNVPEKIFGLPESSFFAIASLISGQELRMTNGLVPTIMLKISPYRFEIRWKLLPKFGTSKNGRYPTRGNPIGPAKKIDSYWRYLWGLANYRA